MVRLYNNKLGRIILKPFIQPFVSNLAGMLLDTSVSTVFINAFIKSNKIDMSDFEVKKYNSFNDFFTRKLKSGARTVDMDNNAFISPCDGFLSCYDIDESSIIAIKGSNYSFKDLFNKDNLYEEYKNGQCLVFRLTPSNYHRYCYIDNGTKGNNVHIKGVYHTVQPIAVRNVPVYKQNTREYTVLNTENFDKIIYMEIGAMLVGRICNYHREYSFKKGEEKGKFEFGGSTIILFLKSNIVKLNDDIINSKKEYPVKIGQKIGNKII